MKKDEAYFELTGLADSLDDHVTGDSLVAKLRQLATEIETEGLSE